MTNKQTNKIHAPVCYVQYVHTVHSHTQVVVEVVVATPSLAGDETQITLSLAVAASAIAPTRKARRKIALAMMSCGVQSQKCVKLHSHLKRKKN